MEKEFSELDGLLEYLGCGKYPVTTTQAPPGTTTPATSTTTPGCTYGYNRPPKSNASRV